METIDAVRSVLRDALHLGDRASAGSGQPADGGLPEFDSMAVVTVVTMLEDQFGITVADDELSADVFATVVRFATSWTGSWRREPRHSVRPVPGPPGRRVFVLLREPEGDAGQRAGRAAVRRGNEQVTAHVADTASACARPGWPYWCRPLRTGDSEGDFRDAEVGAGSRTWAWHAAMPSARAAGEAILAVRLGCGLAALACARNRACGRDQRLVAAGSGRQASPGAVPALRVAAGSMFGDGTETVEGLRQRSARAKCCRRGL